MITKPLNRTGAQCVSVTLPELLQLSKYSRELPLSSLRPKSSQSGQRASSLLARGMDFAESRRYQSGDDIRNIDWRVTARTGKAHTKLFAAEKERHVLLAVDMRSAMFFATKGVFKSVQAALMMGHVAWNAVQGGDRLGTVIFDEKNLFESRPALGKKGVLPFLHGLAERANFLSKESMAYSADSKSLSMDNALLGIRQMATPGSLVFVISDFRHFSSNARDLLLQISRHNDLCLCFLSDPLERSFPKNGNYPVREGETELHLDTYDKVCLEKYQKQFLERKNQVASLALQRHIHLIECSTEDDCFEVLKNHFK